MTIKEYYDIVLDNLQQGDYKFVVSKKLANIPKKSDIKVNELPLHALNYLIYEYLLFR